MIAGLFVLQAMQPLPVIVAPPPKVAVQARPVPALASRQGRKVAEARALAARADRIRASYEPKAGQPSKAELEASIDQLKGDIDSMSEMGEMESLRLQMAMDRMSKMMATLSNLLKKISETQQSIIQNIK